MLGLGRLSPLSARPLFLCRIGLLFRDGFREEDEISERIANEKLFEPPRLGCQGRLHRIRWQVLLVEHLDIGHTNSAHRVALGRLFGGIKVQSDPVSFEDGKSLIAIRRLKAELPIKGQSLLHILDHKARGHAEKV